MQTSESAGEASSNEVKTEEHQAGNGEARDRVFDFESDGERLATESTRDMN